ncbi:endogenous retrovirus group K member 8 Gag polyprotein isoform X3 [Oryctolagus cuniculus]|uniref:endogenous retrovirus group K member 8 Gag polyprotein isoform X3 n=1 Tax=Oryctolagus cuniculus TaxID=9986 RepID=UPI00222FC706|nr:endogenous retrovirus group K member 8 Gag polyprotein isoform X2 [Oryctolagus cuniculus]
MGQGVSVDSHQCSGVLRQLLKARGVSVAEKDLQGFLAAVPKYNPWFAEHSRLDLREWERVGETLKETRGRVHKNALAVWTQVTLALEPLWGDPAGPDEEQAVPGAPAAPSAPSAPAAPAAPAAPVETPLQRALREGAQDMDVEDMLAFLDAAWPAPGTAVDFRMIKALRESVAENGLRAPFTITLVEAVSRFPLPPNDWFQLARACLNFWDFAIWKSEYSDQAQGQASRNKRLGVNISLDMLTGSGPYLGLAAQASMPAQAYQQIGECARRAWSALPAQARAELPGSYAKCLQGPKEPFSDFVDRLARRLRRQVTAVPEPSRRNTRPLFSSQWDPQRGPRPASAPPWSRQHPPHSPPALGRDRPFQPRARQQWNQNLPQPLPSSKRAAQPAPCPAPHPSPHSCPAAKAQEKPEAAAPLCALPPAPPDPGPQPTQHQLSATCPFCVQL